jgi:ribulose-phosphate 3-epimerase
MIAEKKANSVEVIPTNTCPKTLDELTTRSLAFSSYAPTVHLDVCDERFAPARSWPFFDGQWQELEAMGVGQKRMPLLQTPLQYEVHMMIENPLAAGVAFARAGVSRIIAHVEAFRHADGALDAFKMWRVSGAKEVGLAILMDTPLDTLRPFADICDEFLVMTIATVGKQGIPFDARGIERIHELHKHYPDVTIAADGGISENNIALLAKAGATRFCVGSAIEKQPVPSQAYSTLLSLSK